MDAVKLKSSMFQQALAGIDAGELELETFKGLCTFMATVRRRIGPWLNDGDFAGIREGLVELFAETAPVDTRVTGFCARFPEDKSHRWVRDLATEMLHNRDPERYPLMNRWIWDARANTGVLREIWHAEDIDHIRIPVSDSYGTFLMLREELSQFLSDNGFFRDVLYYVDVLCTLYLRAGRQLPADRFFGTRGPDAAHAPLARSRRCAAGQR